MLAHQPLHHRLVFLASCAQGQAREGGREAATSGDGRRGDGTARPCKPGKPTGNQQQQLLGKEPLTLGELGKEVDGTLPAHNV